MVDTTVSSSNESNSLIVCNMKYLAILAIALFAIVAAEPEAEADAEAAAAYYGGYYGRGYGYGYGYGLGHRGYYGGYYGHGLYGRGYGYGHYLGKRSADAEPEADAEAGVALYGHAFGYPYGLRAYGAYPYAYGGYYGHYAPLVAGASSHQHVSTPAATYGISQIHKRSADAEPEAEADAEAAAAYYGGYYGRGYGYGHGYGYG